MTEPLRVLHVLDHSLPQHSGYVFRTLAILSEQRRLGWATAQLTSPKHDEGRAGDGAQAQTLDGWTFHRTPGAHAAGPLTQMRALAQRIDALAAEFRPHLIHAHSPVLNALPAQWVGRRRRLPVVYEMRASWEDAAVDHGTTTEGSVRYRASRALESLALHAADQVTTICEGLRGDIRARGVPDDKITVIPNAVDASAFAFGEPADEGLRARLGLSGRTVIGFVGSFYGYEGLHLLLDAAARLMSSRDDLSVLLVGGGYQDDALRAQAVRLGIAERVVFAGRVPHADVQRHYDLIDVLAYPRLPIRLTELVTPLKPLEAMAQGRMFVASDVGGHRELIRDGETGFLFPAGDAQALAARIADVLERRERWPQVRAQARRFVEVERTWASSVARYREVYRRALARRGGAGVAAVA